MNELGFVVMCFFMIKHWIIDSLAQTPYMYRNKGTYGHFGGILHALQHAIFTFAIVILIPLVGWYVAMIAATFDFVVHYHLDYIKVNISRRCNLACMKEGHLEIYSDNYFHLLVLDQCLHFLTYFIILFEISKFFY